MERDYLKFHKFFLIISILIMLKGCEGCGCGDSGKEKVNCGFDTSTVFFIDNKESSCFNCTQKITDPNPFIYNTYTYTVTFGGGGTVTYFTCADNPGHPICRAMPEPIQTDPSADDYLVPECAARYEFFDGQCWLCTIGYKSGILIKRFQQAQNCICSGTCMYLSIKSSSSSSTSSTQSYYLQGIADQCAFYPRWHSDAEDKSCACINKDSLKDPTSSMANPFNCQPLQNIPYIACELEDKDDLSECKEICSKKQPDPTVVPSHDEFTKKIDIVYAIHWSLIETATAESSESVSGATKEIPEEGVRFQGYDLLVREELDKLQAYLSIILDEKIKLNIKGRYFCSKKDNCDLNGDLAEIEFPIKLDKPSPDMIKLTSIINDDIMLDAGLSHRNPDTQIGIFFTKKAGGFDVAFRKGTFYDQNNNARCDECAGLQNIIIVEGNSPDSILLAHEIGHLMQDYARPGNIIAGVTQVGNDLNVPLTRPKCDIWSQNCYQNCVDDDLRRDPCYCSEHNDPALKVGIKIGSGGSFEGCDNDWTNGGLYESPKNLMQNTAYIIKGMFEAELSEKQIQRLKQSVIYQSK